MCQWYLLPAGSRLHFLACSVKMNLGPLPFPLPAVPEALSVDGAGGPLQRFVSWFCSVYSAYCCSTELLQCKTSNGTQWSKVLESPFKQLCSPAPLVRHFPTNSFPWHLVRDPLLFSEPWLCPLQ